MKNILKKIFVIFPIAILCGLLGAFGGADETSKNWRRIGIPLILTIVALFVLKSWWTLILLGIFIPLSMGYGIPCHNDSGSLIGRFWYKYFGESNRTNYFTRGTIGLIICLFTICIPFIKENWVTYLISSFGIISVYAGLSWRGLGNFRFLKKNLTLAEFYTYLAVGFGILLTIFF